MKRGGMILKLEYFRQKLNIYRVFLRSNGVKENEVEVKIKLPNGVEAYITNVKLIQDGSKSTIMLDTSH